MLLLKLLLMGKNFNTYYLSHVNQVTHYISGLVENILKKMNFTVMPTKITLVHTGQIAGYVH